MFILVLLKEQFSQHSHWSCGCCAVLRAPIVTYHPRGWLGGWVGGCVCVRARACTHRHIHVCVCVCVCACAFDVCVEKEGRPHSGPLTLWVLGQGPSIHNEENLSFASPCCCRDPAPGELGALNRQSWPAPPVPDEGARVTCSCSKRTRMP